MWVLLWLHILNGELEYYHIGTYSSEAACNAQRNNAQILKKNKNTAVSCVYLESKRTP